MTRLLFLIHRYLGIALSLAILGWCLSGLVMMYVQYPELTEAERARSLAPLELGACCAWPEDFGNIDLDRFSVEMLGGQPVARLDSGWGEYTLDLGRGRYLDGFGPHEAAAYAREASARLGLGGAARLVETLEVDQWTVGGGYDPHRPLYRFAAGDARGTELYLSSRTGAVVLTTTAAERAWNWLGSVVHWFYPTVVRRHVEAWSQTLIWTSILGALLTVIGLYIGIRQLKRRRNGRRSPYRGLALWHHYAGLVFGILTLSWLFSGLLSLNPWGVLAGRSFAPETVRLHGGSMRLEDAKTGLSAIAAADLPAGTVRLVGELFDGRLYLTAWRGDGGRVRLDGSSHRPAPLTRGALGRAAQRLRPDAPIADQGWLESEDAYYFSHHVERPLPVYRVRYADGERIYLDATSGQLRYAVDASRRGSRWLFLALHRGDFAALVRERPVWDVMMWVLMAGVTVGAATGTWMGIERIARALRRWSRRRPSASPAA